MNDESRMMNLEFGILNLKRKDTRPCVSKLKLETLLIHVT